MAILDTYNLTEEEMYRRLEEAVYPDKISFLDPDFLCFALPMAALFDIFGFILAVSIPLTLGADAPEAVICLVLMDLFGMAIIGGWAYWRTKRLIQSKEQKKQEMQENLQKRSQMLGQEAEEAGKLTTRSSEKIAAKEAESIIARESIEDASKMAAKTAERMAGKEFAEAAGKIVLRTGAKTAADLSIIGILINLIPFWTITVLGMLNNKE